MKEVEVWVTDRQQSLSFVDVDYFHETRKSLEIIQEDLYTTTTTVIYKSNILRYKVFEHR